VIRTDAKKQIKRQYQHAKKKLNSIYQTLQMYL